MLEADTYHECAECGMFFHIEDGCFYVDDDMREFVCHLCDNNEWSHAAGGAA